MIASENGISKSTFLSKLIKCVFFTVFNLNENVFLFSSLLLIYDMLNWMERTKIKYKHQAFYKQNVVNDLLSRSI